jgi:hypothetical protein
MSELSEAVEAAIDDLAECGEWSRELRGRVDGLVAAGVPLRDALALSYLDVSVRDCRQLLERGCPPALVAEILA